MSVTHQETDITWRYVDRRAAAINALRDYQTMEAIIESTPDDLKAIEANLPSLSSPSWMAAAAHSTPALPRTKSLDTWNESITAPANTCKPRITWTGSTPHGKHSMTMSGGCWKCSTFPKTSGATPSTTFVNASLSNAPAPTTRKTAPSNASQHYSTADRRE